MQIDRINGLVGSIAVKVPCQAATTANITLSGAQTVDGVALISNDRCLVKNQTIASENGIYDVSGTEWSRSLDFNGTRDIAQGTCVRIISGTVSGQYFYEVTTSSPFIGTTDIDFALVNFPTTTSSYIATLLDDETATDARTTLVVAGLADNNTLSGTNTFTKSYYLKKGADITSANDLILLADGNYNDITGTTTLNGMTDGIQNEIRHFHADDVFILKHNTAASSGFSSLFIVQGAADITTAANDEWDAIYDGLVWRIFNYNKALYSPNTEGIWIPTLQDSSLSDAESQTYTTQYGAYTKIGNRIFINGHIQMNNLGTLTTSDAALIAGLPFTSSTTANSEGSVSMSNGSLTFTAGNSVTGQIQTNTSYIECRNWDSSGGASTLLISELTAGGKLIFAGQYLTDS